MGMGSKENAVQTGLFAETRNQWQTAIFGRFIESQLHLDIRHWLRVAVAAITV
jgi:hypothetical protein